MVNMTVWIEALGSWDCSRQFISVRMLEIKKDYNVIVFADIVQ